MLSLANPSGLADKLVGRSSQMQVLREQVCQLAQFDINLLLQGESGVGKELVSRTIHELSERASGPFVGVNCAAIHESLLESELFGHKAGAFTGADKPSLGFLRAADGGTILLDEVGDMSTQLQSKLLRVLEDRTVVPVGGSDGVSIDVRIIAATNRDLAKAVAEGSFRKDLYYRLNVVCLDIPPLRDRPQDVGPLVDYLLDEIGEVLDVPRKTVSPDAMELLICYDWPGNVRELGNVIQRAYALGRGQEIQVEDLPEQVVMRSGHDQSTEGGFISLREAVRRHVAKALELSEGGRTQAARLLDIDRKSLWRMMRRHGMM